MVELKDIKKNYANFDLKINLKINKGEIFGLIGQSGSFENYSRDFEGW